ncbi:MAG: polysaccharide deacetylase family protein [Betaproteobacteria bacterium]
MTAWHRLDDELDAWRAAGRQPTLWCRDDDACRDTPALRQLLAIAAAQDVPVALASIPASLAPDLVDVVMRSPRATVIQHGYAHANHALPLERKRELGTHRPLSLTLDELQFGQGMLRRGFGGRFAAVLVPPWNRIAVEVIERLPGIGFLGLSTLGPRGAIHPVPSLVQCNTHVDLIAWRSNRAFVGTDAAIECLLLHLRARRNESVDAIEPTGILTHHLDMDAAGWRFMPDLLERTRKGGALWLDVQAVFAASATATTTFGRST